MARRKDKLAALLDISLDFAVASKWFVGDYFVEDDWVKPKSPDEQHKVRFYYPLRDASLFASFARLGMRQVPSESKILKWVREHGLLEWDREIDPYRPPSIPEDYEEVRQAPWSLAKFREEVRLARSVSLLYRDLSRVDSEALRGRLVAMHLEQASSKPGELSEIDRNLVTWYGDPEKRDWLPLLPSAQRVFQRFMEQRLWRARLSWWNTAGSIEDLDYYELPPHMTDAFEPIQALRCPDLLTAIYMQLFLMVIDVLPTRFCENPVCQTPFPAFRKDKAYCSDTCRSNARHYR